MKSKKRCVVVCDGLVHNFYNNAFRGYADNSVSGLYSYFEWLKKGKERLPHFIRRRDKKLMILAGLYDSVILEGKFHGKMHCSLRV